MYRLISLSLCAALLPFSACSKIARSSEAEKEESTSAAQAKAESVDFSHVLRGIAETVQQLPYVKLENAKRNPIEMEPRDDFKVDSTSEEYIFYRHKERREDPIYIAVPRKKGEFYTKGAMLQGRYFRIVESIRVATVGGSEVDIIVLEGIPPFSSLKNVKVSIRKPKEEKPKSALQIKAEGLGMANSVHGVARILGGFPDGGSIEAIKTYLIETSPQDDFRVVGTSGKFIFYCHEELGREPVYVAVLRKKGAFYPEGSSFNEPYFRVVGLTLATTAGGSEIDALVLEGLK